MADQEEKCYDVYNMPRLRLGISQTGDSLVIEYERGPAQRASRARIEAEARLSDLDRSSFRRKYVFDKMNQKLDLEEVRNLCFFLGIDYDRLGGEGKTGKIRELYLFMERKGRVDELMSALREKEVV